MEWEGIIALHRPSIHIRRNRRTLHVIHTHLPYDETPCRCEDLPNSVDFPAEVGIGDIRDHDDTGGELKNTRNVRKSINDVGHTPLDLPVRENKNDHPLGHGECQHADGSDEDGEHV